MPEYKLTYFNAKGRAELIRWIFAYGKIPYTDDRIMDFKDWATLKPTIHSHQVPVLTVDGKPLGESLAIARYAAKQVGLVPTDDFLAAQVDEGVDAFSDLMPEVRKIVRSPGTEDDKAKLMREELYPNTLVPFMKNLEKKLEGKDWFVGDKVTWLDFNSAVFFGRFTAQVPNLFDGLPNLKKNADRVMALPGVKEWVAKRPKTFL